MQLETDELCFFLKGASNEKLNRGGVNGRPPAAAAAAASLHPGENALGHARDVDAAGPSDDGLPGSPRRPAPHVLQRRRAALPGV